VVIIDHGDNVTSVYAHLSRIAAQKGDNVNKGALIAYVGSTGFSTGPHLHFEIRIDGKVVDPLKYLN
jgi:murein DD-endopeptidase MepM/ murein hydrolase activator NlpD